jgi:hypothetical protein
MSRRGLILVVLGAFGGPTAVAQVDLAVAVEAARSAWMRHDARALFSTSDTVRLRLPEVPATQGLQPAQAVRLLVAFWAGASEIQLDVRDVRQVADGHAYAELERGFGVRGTGDRQVQSLYFGFRLEGDVWRLREVRITR